MIYTKIVVYENGTEIASSIYDASKGYPAGCTNKNTEERIKEIVNELFGN